LSNGEHADEKDRQQAEIFDALGHPTRIVILKALSEGPAGFAELKKKTGIESSGHLLHHLNKLNGLVKTDEYGKYCPRKRCFAERANCGKSCRPKGKQEGCKLY
jgi:DNA-binding HxlR family transcriptional regulator